MGRVAFVFSGQGDQYPGMGKELCERFPEATQVYHICDSLRPGTSFLCFSGTEEELKETRNTQPCLFAMELALATVLMKRDMRPDVLAGFSLGEIVAATVSGMFSTATGFSLVCKRGELMQREADRFDTSMAAVVKLEEARVKELCAGYPDVYPVNFNCPGQISVAGRTEQMSAFSTAVKEAGGRAIPLKVKGAFHSPFMKEAAEDFAKELRKAEFSNREIELYSDKTAQPYSEDAVGLLSEQICSPVRFEQLIRNMIADGVDTFVEIGPGNTLTNMIHKIDPSVTAKNGMEYIREVEAC